MQTAGRINLGLGSASLGLISVIYLDFALTWQPVPDWVEPRPRWPVRAARC